LKRSLFPLVLVVSLFQLTTPCLSSDNADLFRSCLTVADVEEITSLEGVTMQERFTSPSRDPGSSSSMVSRQGQVATMSLTKEFSSKDGRGVLRMTIGPAALGACSMEFERSDKSSLRDHEVSGIGDKALLASGYLVFAKGNYCVTVRATASQGKDAVSREHLIAIGERIAGRL